MKTTIRSLVRQQYIDKVNVQEKFKDISRPKEGWIRTVRKALGISGTQLGNRLNVGRSQISRLEKAELEDKITLKTLRELAMAMNCRLEYTFIPQLKVEEMLEKQARKQARAIVKKTSVHMALEKQELSEEHLEREFERLVSEILNNKQRVLWDD